MELRQALAMVHQTDALACLYVIEGATRQARINLDGLPLVDKPVWVHCFFADVDTPTHTPFDEAWFEAARKQDLELECLRTAGVYYTKRGRRIVQPLAQPIPAQIASYYFLEWTKLLIAQGVAADPKCAQWNHLFKLPNIPSLPGGRSRCIDLERMVPIAIDTSNLPPAEPEEPTSRKIPKSCKVASAPMVWGDCLPEQYRDAASSIARAVLEVQTSWHELFMGIAGALLRRGVAPEHVPAFCEAISRATCADTRTEDRVVAARSTVERWRKGQPFTGYQRLMEESPAVAEALASSLATGLELRLREQLSSEAASELPSLAESTAKLEDAIRSAPDGLTLIAAACGLGKTRAAEKIAAERAGKAYVSDKVEGLRAPAQSKTSISVDKHTLSKQIVGHLNALGATVGRVFGPLSVKDEEGMPVCQLHDLGKCLVEGAQSMQWELCKGRKMSPCDLFESCPAARGFEGPERPRILVGPHPMLAQLDESAGSTGLLIIDEPPSVLENLSLTVGDIDHAVRMRHCFEGRFATAMQPALMAIRAWLRRSDVVDVLTTLDAAIRACDDDVGIQLLEQAYRVTNAGPSALDCAKEAPVRQDGPASPPLSFEQIALAREHPEHAERLGRASRTYSIVYQGAASDLPVAARVIQKGETRILVLTRARKTFVEGMRRDGAVVVLDANADIWAPIYAKIVGYERPVLHFDAPDGAPIERTILRLGSANRTGWQPGGKLLAGTSLRTALRSAIEWALSKPGNSVLALISMKLVRTALEACLRPDDPEIVDRWKALKQSPAVLAELRSELSPILAKWPGRILLGHYGALKGLDDMAEADCLATLGDPWFELDTVKAECLLLGVDDWEKHYEALCRAELEQAHGRLRTIHRQRPGRALHVGKVAPGGRAWSSGQVTLRIAEVGRPKGEAAMTAEAFAEEIVRVGGVKPMARLLGCTPKAVRKYRNGETPVSDAIAQIVGANSTPPSGMNDP